MTATAVRRADKFETIEELRISMARCLESINIAVINFNVMLQQLRSEDDSRLRSAFPTLDEVNADLILKRIDGLLYEDVVTSTGIFDYITKDARDEILRPFKLDYDQSDEKKNIPVFTKKTADALLVKVTENLGNVRALSAIKVIESFRDKYYWRSHSSRDQQAKFKFNKKLRFNHFGQWDDKFGGFSYGYGNRDCLHDIFGDLESICNQLRGKPILPVQSRISSIMKDTLYYSLSKSKIQFPVIFETNFFKITVYKKGTVLLEFKNDIENDLNKVIAKSNQIGE